MQTHDERATHLAGPRWMFGVLLLLPALALLFWKSQLVARVTPSVGTERRATSLVELVMWVLIAAASFTAPQAKRVARLLLLLVVLVYLVSAIRSFL